MAKLSIVIPARNEEWLSETLADLWKNLRGDTEVIVVLDGAPAVKPLPSDPRLVVIEHKEARGQRAATNDAVRLSRAKYIMKVDAHCAFDEGFDVKMMDAMELFGDTVTMVPTMRNLHVFDWVCEDGHRRYQSPSGVCETCGKATIKDVVWNPKKRPESTSYCFDHTLHFQYFKEFQKRPEGRGDYTETMSMQGSAFMLTRERYWALDICEEKFGSWGAQGTEVACKTWLSGGRCIVNQKTWYGHLFRTQGGDFSFPYKQDNNQVENARKYSRELFLDNTWAHQVYPLSWLVDKFQPVPGWHDDAGKDMLEKVRAWGARFPLKNETNHGKIEGWSTLPI
jgi:glycosyltransferase involved in cell wall biosynthesis